MTNLFMTLALLAGAASAQPPQPNAAGVAMGHLHIRAADLAPHQRFWTTLLETEPRKHGNLEVLKYPGGMLLLQSMASNGGTVGSSVDHVGFLVKNLARAVKRLQQAGFQVPAPTGPGLFLMAPGEVRVELIENATLSTPVASHHIHFFTPAVNDTKAWYVKTFGAVGGKRNNLEAADIPGVNLTYTPVPAATAPTKGRVLDHIGFEVRDLEAFCRKLQAEGVKFDVPLRKVEALGLKLAFITDPWGTHIELTEGLREW